MGIILFLYTLGSIGYIVYLFIEGSSNFFSILKTFGLLIVIWIGLTGIWFIKHLLNESKESNERHAKKEQYKIKYAEALNGTDKQKALEYGRKYYGIDHGEKTTLIEEQIMANDIAAMKTNIIKMGENENSNAIWICPKCGDGNPLYNSYCKGCGEYKPVGVGSNESKNPIPAVKNVGDKWICKECNEINPINDLFCKSCGTYK